MENSRLEELRRRVDRDPASFAFAQLAEEYRRAGSFREAIQVCRTGLIQHPGYHSARVILGRCLVETGDLKAAEIEFRKVLRSAPDNLLAIRGLAEVQERMEQSAGPQMGARDASEAIPALEKFLSTIVAYRRRQRPNRSDAAR